MVPRGPALGETAPRSLNPHAFCHCIGLRRWRYPATHASATSRSRPATPPRSRMKFLVMIYNDDALIEPDLDPQDDDVSPTVEPQR